MIGKSMWVNKIKYLVLVLFITGCTQTRSPINLPQGISLLSTIEPSGLHFPLWSPDGKRIVASYVVEAVPDMITFSGQETRHDIVLIDTDSWETSIINKDKGMLIAEAWSPDSMSFAMFWSAGPNGSGIYAFGVEDPKPNLLFKSWDISPDWMRYAEINGSHLAVTNTQNQAVDKFKLSSKGSWSMGAWSPDMKVLTLINREDKEDSFENIYLLYLDTGILSQFTNDNQYFKAFPTISPNGKLIAYRTWRFTENGVEDKLIISNLDQSCDWTVPLEHIDYFAWSPDSHRMFLIGNEGAYLADLNVIFGHDFQNGNDCP